MSSASSTHKERPKLKRQPTFRELLKGGEKESIEDEDVLPIRKAIFLEELRKSSKEFALDDEEENAKNVGAEEAVEESLGFAETFEIQICPCSEKLLVPKNVDFFICSSCNTLLTRTSVNFSDEYKIQALHRWAISTAISRQLDSWLDGKRVFQKTEKELAGRIYRKIESFPFFRNDLTEVDNALFQVFQILPEIERHMINTNRRGIRKRLINLISMPIFYSTLKEYTEKNANLEELLTVHDKYQKSLTVFLNSLLDAKKMQDFVGALTNCHSIQELTQEAKEMLELQAQASLKSLKHTLAKPSSRSKFQTLYRIFPSTVFLSLLKAGIAVKPGSGLTTKLLLAKPLGGLSLMQRMVYEVLGIDKFKKRSKSIFQELPPELQKNVKSYVENIELDTELIKEITDDDIFQRMIKPALNCSDDRNDENLPKTLSKIKEYLYLQGEINELRFLVNITGDERVANLYRVIMSTIQRTMFKDITAKGSGYIRLIEVLLTKWRVIMETHRSKSSEKEKSLIYLGAIHEIQDATFSLIHGVYRSDKAGTWHELLYWLVDNWNVSDLELDLEKLLLKLSSSERKAILKDASRLAEVEYRNSLRSPGTSSIPAPDIKSCGNLVELISDELVKKALSTKTSVKSTIPKSLSSRLGTKTDETIYEQVLFFLEILYEYEDDSRLIQMGYEKIATQLVDKHSGGAWLWMKKLPNKTPQKGSSPVEIPITDMKVVWNNQEEDLLRANGYIKIWKKLNLKGKGAIFLWYKRSRTEAPIENIVAMKKTSRAITSEGLTEDILKDQNYLPVENSIFKWKKSALKDISGPFWKHEQDYVQIWLRKLDSAPMSQKMER